MCEHKYVGAQGDQKKELQVTVSHAVGELATELQSSAWAQVLLTEDSSLQFIP